MSSYVPFEVREAVDRVNAEQLERDKQWLANAQAVVITGIRIPFWRLVWWLVGITAGVSLINAAFDWLFRVLVGVFAPGA